MQPSNWDRCTKTKDSKSYKGKSWSYFGYKIYYNYIRREKSQFLRTDNSKIIYADNSKKENYKQAVLFQLTRSENRRPT